MPSRSIVALVGALLVLTALDPPAPAHAAGIDVGLSGFHDIVVDEGNDHVFISQGASGAIVVTDLAGSVVTTVAGTTGAAGMTLSPDGAELWAAAPSSHAVLAVDTSTLAVTPYATASDVCPESAAVASGLVWFGSICDTGTNGQIGALDPSDSSVTMFAQGYVPRVYASPAQPDTLISYGAYRLPATLYRYTTGAGATPTLTLSASHYAFGSGAEDAAFTPDGSQIVVVSGQESDHWHQVFNLSDLSIADWYGASGTAWPSAVAINPDGVVAAGYDWHPDVLMFLPGSATPLASYDLVTGSAGVAAGGLAFSSDNLYAVTNDRQLHIVPTPTVTATTDRSTYDFGATATVVGRLAVASSTLELTISAQEVGGTDHELVVGDAVGGQIATTMRVQRTTTFTVTWAGDDSHHSASTSTTVRVRAAVSNKLTGATGHRGRFATFPTRGSATVQALVKPSHAGDCVRFRVEAHLSGRWKPQTTSACMTLNAQSKRTAKIKATAALRGKDLRVQTLWGGDAENLAAKSGYRYFRFTK